MTAIKTNEAEGMAVSFGNLMTLVCTLAFGAALGGFLSVFLAPGSDLALLIGISIFPAVLLGGGLLVEELWFLRLWQHQPHHWRLTITDSTAGPATQADRERSAVFLPLGSVVGAIGGLAVGLTSPMVSNLASVVVYALAGLAYGGGVYSMVQFSALPRLGHGAPSPMQSKHDPKNLRYSRSRFTSGRPEF